MPLVHDNANMKFHNCHRRQMPRRHFSRVNDLNCPNSWVSQQTNSLSSCLCWVEFLTEQLDCLNSEVSLVVLVCLQTKNVYVQHKVTFLHTLYMASRWLYEISPKEKENNFGMKWKPNQTSGYFSRHLHQWLVGCHLFNSLMMLQSNDLPLLS